MSDGLQLAIIVISLLAGGTGILLGYQMYQKYRLPYLSTYLYYLIFIYIFGIYGIVLPGILNAALTSRASKETIETLRLFITFLGIPFLILSLFMFIRLSRDLVHKALSGWFNLVYFSILSLFFFGYGYFLIRIYAFGETRFEMIWVLITISFSIISAIVIAVAMLQLFLLARRVLDARERYLIRIFGLFYLVFYGITFTMLNLSPLHDFFAIGFVFLFFSIHLLPVLFLYINLDALTIESTGVNGLEETIEYFVEKYGISKRETEIIQLICKGKSNQEISDSLYISLQTVKDHVHRIFLKTGVKNRVQLTNLIRTSS
jgi:DNA-binding CsgD family transcriptional regulator